MIAAHINVSVWQTPVGLIVGLIIVVACVVVLLEYGSRWKVVVPTLLVSAVVLLVCVKLGEQGIALEKAKKVEYINHVASEWLLRQGAVRYRNGVLVWNKVEEGTPVIQAEVTAEDFEDLE